MTRLRAKTKWLALEESTLSAWIAGVLRLHVDCPIVCDPVHNLLIRRGGNKEDVTDAIKLCRLLRLDELKIMQTRIIAWISKLRCSSTCAFAKDLSSLKTQLKAKYQQAGMVWVTGTEVSQRSTNSH